MKYAKRWEAAFSYCGTRVGAIELGLRVPVPGSKNGATRSIVYVMTPEAADELIAQLQKHLPIVRRENMTPEEKRRGGNNGET